MALLIDPWELVGWRRLSRCCADDNRGRPMYETALFSDPVGTIKWKCDCGRVIIEID